MLLPEEAAQKARRNFSPLLASAAAAAAIICLFTAPISPAQAPTPAAAAPAGAPWKNPTLSSYLQSPQPQYKTAAEHYAALKAKAKGGTKHTFANLPDWTGLWTYRIGGPGYPFMANYGGKPGFEQPDYLTPENRAAYTRKRELAAKGVEWDSLSDCLPAGSVRWHFEPFLYEFVLRPEEIWMTHEQMNETRRVYTDGRGHLPDDEAYPLWAGDTIGFWDGDTLVSHTTNIRGGEYSRSSATYSDKTETVERWRKVDPNTILADLSIYDPVGLARPMHITLVYRKVTEPKGLRLEYQSCEEGNNAVKTADGATTFVLPGEKGYRDPATINLAPK